MNREAVNDSRSECLAPLAPFGERGGGRWVTSQEPGVRSRGRGEGDAKSALRLRLRTLQKEIDELQATSEVVSGKTAADSAITPEETVSGSAEEVSIKKSRDELWDAMKSAVRCTTKPKHLVVVRTFRRVRAKGRERGGVVEIRSARPTPSDGSSE